MSRGSAPRILTFITVATVVASFVGFLVTLLLNLFVFDDYDAYGEVSIPGSSSVRLPAGDVTVTFHTVLVGGSGNGLPVPPLKYRITGPDGVDDPVLREDYGATTTVNNDARVRIGYLHVPAAGSYDVHLDGNVSAYLDPTLAFGHGSPYGILPWIFVAVFVFAVVDLVIVRIWAARVRRTPVPFGSTVSFDDAVPFGGAVPPRTSTFASDDGIRIEQLTTLARLRDSGALTEDEFQAEKRRLLDGP